MENYFEQIDQAYRNGEKWCFINVTQETCTNLAHEFENAGFVVAYSFAIMQISWQNMTDAQKINYFTSVKFLHKKKKENNKFR